MMPPLETERLLIRPFEREDLQAAYQLFDLDLAEAELHTAKMTALTDRAEWMEWIVRNSAQLAHLYQPPYGDRAIVLKSSGKLIGACGFVPCLMPFEQIPGLVSEGCSQSRGLMTPEVGLFYAVSPDFRRTGYASEVAAALIHYGFSALNLKRIVATTDYDNIASQAVMLSLGMRIERNPQSEPAWMQIVGVIEHPA